MQLNVCGSNGYTLKQLNSQIGRMSEYFLDKYSCQISHGFLLVYEDFSASCRIRRQLGIKANLL